MTDLEVKTADSRKPRRMYCRITSDKSMNMKQLSELCGASYKNVLWRLSAGYSLKDSLFMTTETARRVGNQKHGLSGTRAYSIWEGMTQRCRHHEHYAGRGIKVCESWSSFENFYSDMGDPPTEHHTLERNDGTKGYAKENCRWATMLEQSRNTSRNVLFTYRGETKCISAWAEKVGINERTMRGRIARGFPEEMVFSGEDFRGKDCKAIAMERYGVFI